MRVTVSLSSNGQINTQSQSVQIIETETLDTRAAN